MMFISVDLPEPDAPMMATNSPLWIVRLTSRSTVSGSPPVVYVRPTAFNSRGVHGSVAGLKGPSRRPKRLWYRCPAARCPDHHQFLFLETLRDLRREFALDPGVDGAPL